MTLLLHTVFGADSAYAATIHCPSILSLRPVLRYTLPGNSTARLTREGRWARYPRVEAANSTKLSQTLEAWRKVRALRPEVRSLPVFGGAAAALAVQVFVQLVSRLMQIAFIYDVVPFENALGLVTADKHGHLFRDPARTRFLTPVLLRSWKSRSIPVALTAFSQAFRMSTT
jgi:hypothetical protein